MVLRGGIPLGTYARAFALGSLQSSRASRDMLPIGGFIEAEVLQMLPPKGLAFAKQLQKLGDLTLGSCVELPFWWVPRVACPSSVN